MAEDPITKKPSLEKRDFIVRSVPDLPRDGPKATEKCGPNFVNAIIAMGQVHCRRR